MMCRQPKLVAQGLFASWPTKRKSPLLFHNSTRAFTPSKAPTTAKILTASHINNQNMSTAQSFYILASHLYIVPWTSTDRAQRQTV
ncbi:unnamed protein product [Zymoseptoria tritici ST99CH_3D7]|uniref:Uncharacterized protein n=1 Tax=Zymoseptoria tritici (strain ST99CH_3D7) TaxID=1276538 RepID=A0A1X7RSR8_ZYMT9|nr:unnamed protein product [Zymoseptoria tritici ST99CH_3D7]